MERLPSSHTPFWNEQQSSFPFTPITHPQSAFTTTTRVVATQTDNSVGPVAASEGVLSSISSKEVDWSRQHNVPQPVIYIPDDCGIASQASFIPLSPRSSAYLQPHKHQRTTSSHRKYRYFHAKDVVLNVNSIRIRATATQPRPYRSALKPRPNRVVPISQSVVASPSATYSSDTGGTLSTTRTQPLTAAAYPTSSSMELTPNTASANTSQQGSSAQPTISSENVNIIAASLMPVQIEYLEHFQKLGQLAAQPGELGLRVRQVLHDNMVAVLKASLKTGSNNKTRT
ncbi:hypothetical protein BGX29_010691 [Mortierella sp. GBA35]|nr:hypothetical protein BGX29_010691 [Mortierella sp. GBA35]